MVNKDEYISRNRLFQPTWPAYGTPVWVIYSNFTKIVDVKKQDGLAVASIARDGPPLFPVMIPSHRANRTINSSVLAPACTATAMRDKLGSEFET